MTALDLDVPTRPYIELLREELKAYRRKRAKAAADLAEQPEYAARVDQMWGYAIASKQAQIEREEANT